MVSRDIYLLRYKPPQKRDFWFPPKKFPNEYTLSNRFILDSVLENKVVRVKDKFEVYKLINCIRSQDLREVINRTHGDCFLNGTGSNAPNNRIHFITPSGKHANRFLRLSDAIHSYNALDCISFWLQPYLEYSSAVIVDTWSLSSIILFTQQLLGTNMPFDCFKQPINISEDEALETLEDFAVRHGELGEGPILVLFGVSASGDSFRALEKIKKNTRINNYFKALSIYCFKDSLVNPHAPDVDVLEKLHDFDIPFFKPEDCEYCKKGHIVYPLDKKYYYPREFLEEIVRFKATHLKAKNFILKYGGNDNVLVVHKDDPNAGRSPKHHAFYIDVKTLMGDKEFQADVTKVANKISEGDRGIPNIAILPDHAAARTIVQHLRLVWPRTEFIFEHKLAKLSGRESDKVKQSKHICFVDDVSITGSRITGYLRELCDHIFRSVSTPALKSKTVSWFPLIMRSANDDVEVGLKDKFSKNDWTNKLHYVYKVILPDWNAPDHNNNPACPWCNEKRLFDKHIEAPALEPAWYQERHDLLSKVATGIKSRPLFVAPFDQNKGLGAGSKAVFGPAGTSEMQVLFEISNGLQTLRTTSKEDALGTNALLVRYVLRQYCPGKTKKAEYNSLFVRYHDALIQGCFLRTVKSEEWSKSVFDNGKNTYLEQELQKGNSRSLIGEAILFYLRNRRPMKPQTVQYINGIGAAIRGDDAIQSLLSPRRL